MIPVRSQWGRYNLPGYIYTHIYIYIYIYICVCVPIIHLVSYGYSSQWLIIPIAAKRSLLTIGFSLSSPYSDPCAHEYPNNVGIPNKNLKIGLQFDEHPLKITWNPILNSNSHGSAFPSLPMHPWRPFAPWPSASADVARSASLAVGRREAHQPGDGYRALKDPTKHHGFMKSYLVHPT